MTPISAERLDEEGREAIFLVSYCGDDNPECSDKKPCPVCLGMSNVVWTKGTVEYRRELAPEWLNIDLLCSPKRIADLEAELISLRQSLSTARAEGFAEAREMAAVCSVKEYLKSDGSVDYFVSVQVGEKEITPHVFAIKGRAEYEVAKWNWLLNGAEEPDMFDWLARTADPDEEATIRSLTPTGGKL